MVRVLRTFALVLAPALFLSHSAAAAIDWSKLPAKKIMVFYPARVSYERLTMAKHSGKSRYTMGAKSCGGCHEVLGTEAFYELNGNVYCERCYAAAVAPMCARCQLPILEVSI